MYKDVHCLPCLRVFFCTLLASILPICKRLTGGGWYCEYAVNRFSLKSIIVAKTGKCKDSLLKICIPSTALLNQQQSSAYHFRQDVRYSSQQRDLDYVQISSLNSVHGGTLFNKLFAKARAESKLQ